MFPIVLLVSIMVVVVAECKFKFRKSNFVLTYVIAITIIKITTKATSALFTATPSIYLMIEVKYLSITIL